MLQTVLSVDVCADPAAEEFKYEASCDVRDLITLDDVVEECELGPNGCASSTSSSNSTSLHDS